MNRVEQVKHIDRRAHAEKKEQQRAAAGRSAGLRPGGFQVCVTTAPDRRSALRRVKLRRAAVAPPESNRRPGRRDEEDGVQQADGEAEKFGGEFPLRMPRAVEFSVRGDVRERDPVVLLIPDQYWQHAEQVDDQREPRAGPAQVRAGRRPEREEDRPAKPLVERGVFGEKGEAHPEAGPEPVARGAAGLNRAPAGEQRGGPEQDE